MKVYYSAGPGDVAGTFEHWERGQADPSQLAETYSSQFFDVCRELDLQAVVRSTHRRRARIERDWITLVQEPLPSVSIPKVGWHLQQSAHHSASIATILREGCDAALISGRHYGWMYAAIAGRVKLFTSFHNTLDGRFVGVEPSAAHRMLEDATRRLLFPRLQAVMAVSPLVLRQAMSDAHEPKPPGIVFTPVYDPAAFEGVSAPDHARRPFRLLFAGRVEENKGVFDLVEAAALLRRDTPNVAAELHFDIAGDGGALSDMKLRAEASGVGDLFSFHGYCDRPRLRTLQERAHAFVVPTRSTFREGVTKALVEGALAGRPSVGSEATVSYDYFPGAVLVVPPDRPEGYAEAITRLATDRALYEEARSACADHAWPFFEERSSYRAVLRLILRSLRDGESVRATLAQEVGRWRLPGDWPPMWAL